MMIIRYADGRSSEAVILSRTIITMRVVLQGADDATDLMYVKGGWYTEELEPVQVQFAWQSPPHAAAATVSDYFCSAESASKLVALLFAGSCEARSEALQHFSAAITL
jgi:hypothetical protein